MKTRSILVVFLTLVTLASFGCRSRKKVPPPQPAPPVEAVAPPVEIVKAPTDFVSPPEKPRVEDIDELNRTARDKGWIRDAFFAYDASTLSAEAQEALRQSATWLRSRPELDLLVEGHCDERGTEQYNLALGDRRAETAVAFLATLGVDRTRIKTVSYGEERPFETGSSEAAWAQNRRAHLVLVKRP